MTGPDWDFSKYVKAEPGSSVESAPVLSPVPSTFHEGQPGLVDFSFGGAGVQVSAAPALVTGKPPVVWLVACLSAVLLGGALAMALGATPTWAVVAWILSGPLAIGLLAAFTAFDTRARALGTYARRAWVKPLYVSCLVICGIAVCLAAVRIALWVGRW